MMIVACILSFLGAGFVTYKAHADNKGKMNLTCLLFTFAPFLVGDGIALGMYIGNNHTSYPA